MEMLGHLQLTIFLMASLSSGMIINNHNSHVGSMPDPFDDRLTNNDTYNEIGLPEPDCVLKVTHKSNSHFRHVVFYEQLNFVYLHLHTNSDVIGIDATKYVIGKHIWTWTFYGNEGALEFLNWPVEFGVWSMGLLNNYISDVPVELERVSGNCTNLVVGNVTDNQAISLALVNLLSDLMNISLTDSEKYGPSEFCYKERIYIKPSSLYMLCKHIVCPFKAMQYNCCPYIYDQEQGRRLIRCNRPFYFQIDNLWWIGPIMVSFILFAYVPLPLMNISAHFSATNVDTTIHKNRSGYFDVGQESAFVCFDGKPNITLFNTLFAPFIKLFSSFQSTFSRPIRFILPFLSLSLIGLQLLIDWKHLKEYVLDSIDKGAPMGFRSMLAGYHASTKNFLPYLGGPYVALSLYLCISCIFMVMPKCLSNHLVSGIPDHKNAHVWSPLLLNLKTKEMLGTVTIQHESGYKKIYNTCMAQFYMLLNKTYWLHCVDIQVKRWDVLKRVRACLLLFPFYLIVCVIEQLVCVFYYGMPMTFLALIILNSYYKCIIRVKHSKVFGRFTVICVTFLIMLLIACVIMFLFMMCTIFLDACLLMTRLFIFTYTGIVVFPKSSYGYLIFFFTTVYYVWDSVVNFSFTYNVILKTTIRVCKKLQRANDRISLVIKVGLFTGVREDILECVIEQIRPRRKQAFVSLLWLCVILGAIFVSLELLTKTDRFRELHILAHVSTAIFTCAIPKITRSMFGQVEDKVARKIFQANIKKVVREKLSRDHAYPHMESD